MSAINRQDIISDDVFTAFEQLEKQLRSIIGTTSQLGKSSGAATMAEDTKKLTTAESELEKVKKRLAVEQSKQNEEYIQAVQELKKAQQATKELTAAENRELGTLEKLSAENKQLTSERQKLNLSTKEGEKRLMAINRQLDQNNKKIRESSDALTKQKINIGNYASALEGLSPGFSRLTSGINQANAAGWKFAMNPIGAIIAAIAAVVAILVAAFKDFAPVVDWVEQRMAALGAVFNVFKTLVIDVVTGQKSLTEAFTGLGGAMSDAAKEAIALNKAQQDLDDNMSIANVNQSKYKRQIDELLLQAKDRTKSEEERVFLLEKAIKLEEAAYSERAALAKENTRIKLGELIAGKRLTEQELKNIEELGIAYIYQLENQKQLDNEKIKAYEDALVKEEDILRESISIREKAQNRQNALLEKQDEEAAKRREAQIKAEEDRIKEQSRLLQEELALYKSIQENEYNAWREGIEKQVEETKKMADLRLSIEKKLASDMTTINANYRKSQEDADKAELERQKQLEETKKEFRKESLQLTKELFSGFTNLRIEQIGQELNAIEHARDREIEAAGDNARLKNEIDKKYDKKKRELQRKQVAAEKANSLFQIAINTAVGIANALSKVVTIPLVPVIAAAGAAQAAFVLAQPLPQFDKGTDRSPADYIAGEKRPELRKSRGKWSLVDKPTLFTDSPGDKIVSGKQTDSILGSMADTFGDNILTDKRKLLGLLNNEYKPERKPENLAYILQSNNEALIRTILNKKEVSVNVNSRGNKVTEKSGNITVNRIDFYYNR